MSKLKKPRKNVAKPKAKRSYSRRDITPSAAPSVTPKNVEVVAVKRERSWWDVLFGRD